MLRLILAFLTLIPASHATISEKDPTIRVIIAKNTPKTELKGVRIYCFPPTLAEAEARQFTVGEALVAATPAGFTFNGNFYAGPILICQAADGPISLNKRPYDGKLFFHLNGNQSFQVVNELDIDAYITNVLHHEVSPSWPAETLKAQAVAARTYALAMRRTRAANPYFDVESTTLDQVYKGIFHAQASIAAAVAATRGQVLTQNGKIVKAFYSSSCGGHTEKPSHIWPEGGDLPAKKDPYCLRSPDQNWEYQISRDRLALRLRTILKMDIQSIQSLDVERFEDGMRVKTVQFQTNAGQVGVTGNEFRRVVGFRELKSTWFDVKRVRDGWSFRGRGYGHGAGLCQWGAREMGERGMTSAQILEFYYPGTKIVTIY